MEKDLRDAGGRERSMKGKKYGRKEGWMERESEGGRVTQRRKKGNEKEDMIKRSIRDGRKMGGR